MVTPSAETSILLRMPPALRGDSLSPSRSPVEMTCAVMFSAARAGRSRCVTPQPAAKAVAIDKVMAMRFMDNPPRETFAAECYAAKPHFASATKNHASAME